MAGEHDDSTYPHLSPTSSNSSSTGPARTDETLQPCFGQQEHRESAEVLPRAETATGETATERVEDSGDRRLSDDDDLGAGLGEVPGELGVEVGLALAAGGEAGAELGLALVPRIVLHVARHRVEDARVLCLDEPTAGLAQRETEAFGPLLVSIRREMDASMIVIEHDMPLIMSMSDRVYYLEAGTVIAEGTPHEVRNDGRVIASYLGTDERAIARSNSGAAPPVGREGDVLVTP